MQSRSRAFAVLFLAAGAGGFALSQERTAKPPASTKPQPTARVAGKGLPADKPGVDAVEDVQTPRAPRSPRPELKQNEHDQSDIFSALQAPRVSNAVKPQANEGRMAGFDFARDPLNATRPGEPAEEITKRETAARPAVNDAQRQLLESRFNLAPRHDPEIRMSRGKPICLGPTARLPEM